MLYRLAIVLIIAFWVTMSALLVRLQIGAEQLDLLNVPVSHVWKLMMTHNQPSYLAIQENGGSVGRFALHPRRNPSPSAYAFDFNGNIRTRQSPQQVLWEGAMAMNREFELEQLRLTVSLRHPQIIAIMNVLPRKRRLHYELQQAQTTIDSGEITLDDQGLRTLLENFGIEPAMLAGIQPRVAEQPSITARQSSVKFRGEKVVVWQVSLKMGDVVFGDIYVSQLGQVLIVKTPFGYSAVSEEITL